MFSQSDSSEPSLRSGFVLWLWSDHVWVKVTLHTWFGNRQIQQWMSSLCSYGSYTHPWWGHMVRTYNATISVRSIAEATSLKDCESCSISHNLSCCGCLFLLRYLFLPYLVFTGTGSYYGHYGLLGCFCSQPRST